MTKPKKVLAIGSIPLIFASALHTRLFPAPLCIDWDVNNAMIIIGLASLALSAIQKPAANKKELFSFLLCGPFLFTLFFSFFELATEFDPQNNSKGFGMIYLIVCYPASVIGASLGLFLRWFIEKTKCSSYQ